MNELTEENYAAINAPNKLLIEAKRRAKRKELIDALRGGPQHLYHYCIGRICSRHMVELVTYGNAQVDMDATAVDVLRMFAQLYPFIDKLKQGETAHETS